MAARRGTLELVADELGSALAALQDVLQVDNLANLFLELGMDDPPTVGGDAQFVQRLTAAADQCSVLESALADLAERIEADDLIGVPGAVARVLEAIAALTVLLDAVATDLKRATETSANAATVAAFAEEMVRRMLEAAIVRYLETVHPTVERILAIMTVVEVTPLPLPPAPPPQIGTGDGASVIADADPLQLAQRRLHLDRIGPLLQDPTAFLKTAYDWGEESFDGKKLFGAVNRLFDSSGPLSVIDEKGDAAGILSFFAVSFAPTTDAHPPGIDGLLHVDVAPGTELVLAQLDGNWRFSLGLDGALKAGLEMRLLPPSQLDILPPEGVLDGKMRLGFVGENPDPQQPLVIFGLTGGGRLEARRLEAGLLADLKWDAGAGRAKADTRFEAKALDGMVITDTSGGDSFLSSLTGHGKGRSAIDIGVTWSPNSELKFIGSSALELAIPAHARIGPATIETVYVVCNIKDGKIPLELSAAVRGELGPFKAVIDRVGVEFTASFPEDGGNLGPMQFDARFKPPSGVGLSIEGGGFTGGGFLRFDKAKGEYAGALELQFRGFIDVKAIGILNTRLPDGGAGYSLVIIITSEFTPLQLGLGFTLLGVGGLLGVNRTVLEDQLKLGIGDGTLNSILFPKDVITNAPRIINDLQRVFPPRPGHYLIGPMSKLGWGTPTLISVEMGVIYELPSVFIVGVLRMAAPADDVPVLQLQVNFIGEVDFGKWQLSFDATLVNSRFLNFTLTGDMAVRAYWLRFGDENLLLTVGGFHPSYTPPPMALGQIDRLAISLFQGNPNLRAEGYFAVTSNTHQFGAKIEVQAGVKIFNVYGFVALDAIFNSETMRFVADIAGMVAVRSGSSTLFAIRLELTLEGPFPLHARGRGSFEIGFIVTVTISVSFDITIGVERLLQLPFIKVFQLLEAALNEERNWRSALRALARAHVSTRDAGPGAPLILSPCGTLGVMQRIAPLNLPLARMGSQRVEGASTTFSIVNVLVGGKPAEHQLALTEKFAAAQFFDMSDAEKLSRRSFEPFDAGLELGGGDAPNADFQRVVDVAYEVVYLRKQRQRLLFRLKEGLVDLLVSLSAAGRSKLSGFKNAPTGLGTPPVVMPRETFVIAGVSDLQPHGAQTFGSESAAVIAMRGMVVNDASLAGKLQVVSSYELAA